MTILYGVIDIFLANPTHEGGGDPGDTPALTGGVRQLLATLMRFLTARWSNLFLATYAVPEGLLRSRLPPGLELDRRDGQCFASLVAFDFLDTRVLGVPWPGFRHFPEVNLAVYVNFRGRAAWYSCASSCRRDWWRGWPARSTTSRTSPPA